MKEKGRKNGWMTVRMKRKKESHWERQREKRMNNWLNEREIDKMIEWKKNNEWKNKWMYDSKKEWHWESRSEIKERMNEWLNEGKSDWLNVRKNGWKNEWITVREKDRVKTKNDIEKEKCENED